MTHLKPTDPRPGVEYIAIYDAARRHVTYWATRTDQVTAKGCESLAAATDMVHLLEAEGFAVRGHRVVEA